MKDVEWKCLPPIEEIIPPNAVPMIDCSGGDVTHITSRLAGGLEPALVLAQSVGLWQTRDGGSMAVIRLERVNLFKEVKVAFVAAFQSLIRLFVAKDLHGALKAD